MFLEEGNSEAAEAAARQAADEFHAESEVDEEAYANTLIARILVEEHKYSQAEQAIKVATDESSKSEDQAVRLATSIMAGEVHTATGKSTEAAKELQAALVDAAKFGYRGYEFEARLALGLAEMNFGKPDGRAHLEALEKEARNRGFGLIARKAAFALAAKPMTPNVAHSL